MSRFRIPTAVTLALAAATLAAADPQAGAAARAADVAGAAAPGVLLEGSVVNRAGEPVAGARVIAAWRPAGEPQPRAQHREAVSGDDGAFAVRVEGEGPWSLLARHAAYADEEARVESADRPLRLVLAPGRTWGGVVLDRERGTPIPGAEARLTPRGRSEFVAPELREVAALRARTGRDGRFILENLDRREYGLTVTAPGRALKSERVDLRGSVPTAAQVYLEPGYDVPVRVVDTEGAPVAGAHVRVQPRPTSRGSYRLLRELEASGVRLSELTDLSDEDGALTLRGLPLVEEIALSAWVDHDDYAGAIADLPTAGTALEAPLVLVLDAGATITGRLMQDETTPVEGTVLVRFRPPRGRGLGGPPRREFSKRVPLEEGTFVVERVPPGAGRLALQARDVRTVERDDVALEAGETLDLGELRPNSGLQIDGFVRDEAGDPVAEAFVTAESDDPAVRIEESSDDEGYFLVGGLPEEARAFALTVGGSGFVRQRIEIEEPGDEPLEIVLVRLGRARGRVLVGDPPLPAPGAGVTPHRSGERRRFGGRRPFGPDGGTRAQVRDDGAFEIDLAPGTYSLSVASEGYLPTLVEDVEIRPDATTELGDVLLDRGATLRGVVVDRDTQRPLAAADVVLDEPGGGLFGGRGPRGRRGRGPGDDGPRTETDPEGRFVLEALPPGRHAVRVDREGHAPAVVTIEVERGRDPESVRVELGGGGWFEGQVRDDAGVPIEGARVIARGLPAGSGGGDATTDADGRYRIDELPPGEYALIAVRSPFGGGRPGPGGPGSAETTEAEIVEGRSTVVDFPPVGSIVVSGTVLLGGRGIPAVVTFGSAEQTGMRGAAGVSRSDAAGAYEVRLAEAGTYQVTVIRVPEQGAFSPGGFPDAHRVRIEVPDVPRFSRDIVLEEDGVGGFVFDAESGEPLEGVRVTAIDVSDGGGPADGRFAGTASTGADGRYALPALPEGEYRFDATVRGYGSATLGPLEVRSGRAIDGQDFWLEPAPRLTLRVRGDGGQPIEGAVAVPLDRPVMMFGGRSGVDGMLMLESIGPGVVTLGVAAAGWAPAVLDIEMLEGEPAEVGVVLERGVGLRLRVVDAEGAPVSGARVRLGFEDGLDLTRLIGTGGLFGGSPPATDGSGTLFVPALEAGAYELEVREGDRGTRKTVTLEEGIEELELSLR